MNKTQWIQVLTPVVVPLIVTLLKLFIPKVPKQLLPILGPILGALIDLATSQQLGVGTAWGAALGAAGVGLREVYDQLVGAEAQKRAVLNAVPQPQPPKPTV